MFANPAALRIRSIARRSGVLVQLVGLYRRHVRGDNYEWPFERLLMRKLQPTDVVWDVGANEGIYTTRFAARAAEVVAFEPSPQTLPHLRARVAGLRNVRIEPVALSETSGEATFYTRDDGYGVAESLDRPSGYATTPHTVQVRRGDDFPCPTKAKVDVEGFELEVLEGMAGHLTNPTLKALFIEVHFAQLEARGLADAPTRIVKLLRQSGFRVSWPDPSHIFASRA